MATSASTRSPDATFYFDLASPLAYMAAERVLHAMPIATEWQPVLARELPGAESFEAFRCRDDEEIFRLEVERRATELGLQQLRWPNPFPFDSTLAMRVATYAKSIGRVVAFAQAAFRQAFAGGHPLEETNHVLIAAAACEMHPSAVLKGAELRSVGEQLSAATAAAADLGVGDVPAVRVGERLFHGERLLEGASAYARTSARTRGVGLPEHSHGTAYSADVTTDTIALTSVEPDPAADAARRRTS
jgi:2-hydroxychromene-2-carboxylate isomerase